MVDEFQKGYDKALKDLAEKLKVKGIDISDVLIETKKERTQFAKPTIYFTKLNKKGDLEYDRDKTMYYANHPEELDSYFASQRQLVAPKKQKAVRLELISNQDPRYEKVFKDLIGDKTTEMCSAENKLIWQDFRNIEKGHSPEYLNAFGNQLVFITQNPVGFQAVCEAAGESPDSDDALSKVVDKCVGSELLFIGSK